MGRSWTFGRKLALGFAVTAALAIVMAGIAVFALNRAVASKDRVIAVYAQNLIDAAKLQTAVARKAAGVRGYMLVGRCQVSLKIRRSRDKPSSIRLAHMKPNLYTAEGKAMILDVQDIESKHQALVEKANAMRRPTRRTIPSFASCEVT